MSHTHLRRISPRRSPPGSATRSGSPGSRITADLTVRNLLNHTAGMVQPYFEDPDFAVRLGEVFRDPDAYMTPEEFIAETVLDAEPLFPAGGGYHYSDVHYTLAGLDHLPKLAGVVLEALADAAR